MFAMPVATVSVPDTGTSAQWEERCRRCGGCCFEKSIDSNGRIRTTTVPCRFLDIHERTCRVYDQRHQREEDCIKLTPENVGSLDWLPTTCAYRSAPD